MNSAKDNLTLENYMDFKSDQIYDAMEWAVENIFQRIWLDETWDKPAKGGKHPDNPSFEKHKDMLYPVHIFSGCAMALRALDYYYDKFPEKLSRFKDQELENHLKRAIFGFLFHDYNKLVGPNDRSMVNKEPLLDLVTNTLGDMLIQLNLTGDDVYDIATLTEKGTSFNYLSNDNRLSNLQFEMDFSRLADVLSSRFNDKRAGQEEDIKFGPEIIISGKRIKHITFANTNLVAITDILKKSCINVIEKDPNAFYLWSDFNSVYYIGPETGGNIEFLKEKILKAFSEKAKQSLRPEKLLRLNDRTIEYSGTGFVSLNIDSLMNFLKSDKGIRSCIYLEDIKINSDQKIKSAWSYTDRMSKYQTRSFSFNYRFVKEKKGGYSLRDGLKIKDYEDEQYQERLHIFVLRYIQLVSSLQTKDALFVRERMGEVLKENADWIGDLSGKENRKSVLVFPQVLEDLSINWDGLVSDILRELNSETKEVDYESILRIVLPSIFPPEQFPDVPSKFSISMVNGYPAKDEGKGDKLFGLNTNGFNNRLPTAKIGFGKVDELSIYEYSLRRSTVLNSQAEGTLTYLRFPGAIPHMDITSLLGRVAKSRKDERLLINNVELSIDPVNYLHQQSNEIRFEDSILLSTSEIGSEEAILRTLYNALDTAKKTKMQVRVSFTNAPIFEDQTESIRFDISSSILSYFSWYKIRCNEFDEIQRKIQTFNVVQNGSLEKINFKDTSRGILRYTESPMSIFSDVHNIVFKSRDGKVYPFGKQFSKRIDDVRKLGYEVEKKGENKMKGIRELARIGSSMKQAKWKMSGSERTWMLRDSLEALEVMRAKTNNGSKRSLGEYKDVVSGVLSAKLRRDQDNTNAWIPVDRINEFSDALIRLLEEDFLGKIPTGAVKSYLIDAFEFEYMLTINSKGGE